VPLVSTWRLVGALVLCGAAAGAGVVAHAAESSAGASSPRAAVAAKPASKSGAVWRVSRFVYRAEGKRVAEVLLDFASSQGLPAVIAEGIEGSVQANFDTTPDKFLDAMTRTYGVIWYHDGTALYFYPTGSVQSRLFRLKGFRREQVTELLESLQIGDRRFPLRFNAAESTLLVYGPPRHVELVGAAIESLDAGAMERNRKTVRVVPLRIATARDRSHGHTRIRGLAAIMTSLYSGTPTASTEHEAPPLAEVQSDKLRALQGVMGPDNRLADVLGKKSHDAGSAKPMPKSGAQRGLLSPIDDDAAPVFIADEGTNSIVILARPQRMAEYVEVIHRLDVQPVLVELEATIIDVSSDSLDTLGIDWSVKGSRGSVSVTHPQSGTSPGTTFNISTLWADAGRELLARVDALGAQGKARVVAKPKVLGVANRPAVMREKRVATVRVAGNLEANLFQVEAGTLLQVTPQITSVPEPGGGVADRIKLSLYIEDGNFEQASVDNIPVVKRTEIMTEAHVGEGESLLIGGITTTSESSQLNEVQGLGRIPLLGALFRHRNDTAGRSERLFLISPRLVREPLLAAAPAVAPAPATLAAPVTPAAPAAPLTPPSATQPSAPFTDALPPDE
jgi:type III secretion protein C